MATIVTVDASKFETEQEARDDIKTYGYGPWALPYKGIAYREGQESHLVHLFTDILDDQTVIDGWIRVLT